MVNALFAVQLSLVISDVIMYVSSATLHIAGTIGQVRAGFVLSSFLKVAGDISHPLIVLAVLAAMLPHASATYRVLML
jgi:hypothetical protein